MGVVSKSNVYTEVEQAFGSVPEWFRKMPETLFTGFWAEFRDFYLAETKIPNKYKELIGLGVSAATRCHYCALFHTEAAKLHGATDEELAEAAAMAGLTMQASTYLHGIRYDVEKFRKETLDIITYVKANNPALAKKGPQERPLHA